MSLESSVSTLTTSVNTLTSEVTGKITEIDAAVAGVPDVIRTALVEALYVDAVHGDDAQPGTFLQPKRTIKAAVESGPQGGFLQVFVFGAGNEAYTFSASEVSIFVRSRLQVSGVLRTSEHTLRQMKLISPWYADSTGDYKPAGFYNDGISPGVFIFFGCDFQIDAPPVGVTLRSAIYRGVISGNTGTSNPFWTVDMGSAQVENLSTEGFFIASSVALIGLSFVAVTGVGMSGKWVNGIPAGADPALYPRLVTNLGPGFL